MAIYFVTGAAGFVASRVCEFLLNDGHTVVGIDNLNGYYDVRLKDYRLSKLLDQEHRLLGKSPQDSIYLNSELSISGSKPMGVTRQPFERTRLVSTSGRFIFEQIDVENLAAINALFSEFKFTAVYNLAARAGVRASMEDPFSFLSTNTLGTLNILECMRKFNVKIHVLASTSSLYAGSPTPWSETQPVNTPLSPYAATKKGAELLAYSYYKLYGLNTSVVRFFTVFGPGGRPDMSVFRFIKWIDEGLPIDLFGDGTQTRDFTFVDDIARGTILAAQPFGYEVINLGGGRYPISLQQIIGWIEQRLGKKAMINGRPFHIADIRESWADIAKAGRLLKWVPKVSVEDGLQQTITWYLANKEWIRTIKI